MTITANLTITDRTPVGNTIVLYVGGKLDLSLTETAGTAAAPFPGQINLAVQLPADHPDAALVPGDYLYVTLSRGSAPAPLTPEAPTVDSATDTVDPAVAPVDTPTG